MDESQSRDFIRQVIDEDLKTGKYDGRVHTRFPPEPNGYLHLGSAKAIWVNYGIADEYGGKFNLRFDDTNPIAEEKEFIDSIVEDVKWLGADFEDRLLFSSDYFQQMYDYAIDLIKKGKAYVCDLNAEDMKEYRGDYNTPGKNSPNRERSVEENLDLFERMKKGEFPDGSKTLRAKIDMTHPNMNMRDPPMYRILHATHPHSGDEWCIYPIYDWAHGLEDSIEGITHSLCSIEFENHRPLYDWFLDELDIYHPQQIEFARMNVSYTIMSKRFLKELVTKELVNGWDDPRMPTICGMRRRGYTPEAVKEFCYRAGIAKKANIIAFELLEACVRDDLNKKASRVMGVLDPLKIVIDNFPEGEIDMLDAINNPEDPDAGSRQVPFTREIFIERADFMEEPVKKFFRLAPGREVRLRYAYLLTCNDIIKNDAGDVVELHCSVDLDSRGGNAPDGRKVKATIHWVSATESIDTEIRLYDRLFTVENPMGEKDHDYKEFINPDSFKTLAGCKVEPAVKDLEHGDTVQFERTGYFCVDPDSTDGNIIFNRTVGLRDSWARMQKGK